MTLSKGLIRGLCAVAATALLGAAGAASAAVPVTWNVTGVFNDGGTLSGTFTMNEYDFLKNDFSLTTTAGSLEPGFTYTKDTSYFSNTNPSTVPASPIYIDFQPQYFSDLHIQFANDLGVSAPTNLIIGGYQGPSLECLSSWSCPADGGSPDYAIRYLVSGQATVAGVPEPATWAVMMLGLGGLGVALRTRRRQLAATA